MTLLKLITRIDSEEKRVLEQINLLPYSEMKKDADKKLQKAKWDN